MLPRPAPEFDPRRAAGGQALRSGRVQEAERGTLRSFTTLLLCPLNNHVWANPTPQALEVVGLPPGPPSRKQRPLLETQKNCFRKASTKSSPLAMEHTRHAFTWSVLLGQRAGQDSKQKQRKTQEHLTCTTWWLDLSARQAGERPQSAVPRGLPQSPLSREAPPPNYPPG